MSQKKKPASEDALAQLHSALANAYKNSLDTMIKDGEINASLLTSVANFLRTNGVFCEPADSEDMEELRDKAGNVLEFPYDPAEEA